MKAQLPPPNSRPANAFSPSERPRINRVWPRYAAERGSISRQAAEDALACGSYRMQLHWRMRFTWSERKRASNVKDHGLDFIDAPRVFEGRTFTFEDDRFAYGEQRFVTLGLLAGVPVSVVHTESEDEIRVISFRKATKHEAEIYFREVED